jgi:hypothetical protein
MKKLQSILPWIVVLCGIGLRVQEYIANRSLWVDEAYLAVAILSRTFLQLLKPLDGWQHAPYGFLWVERGLSYLFGGSDYVLRIFPMIAGILGLILFKKLAERIFSPLYSFIALMAFAFSDLLIRYSVELKQYSTELCVMVLLYLVCIPFPKKLSWNKGLIFLGIGIASMLFSHTAILFLVTLGFVATIQQIRLKQWRQSVGVVVLLGIWLGLFMLLYMSDALQAYKDTYYMSEWPFLHMIPMSFMDLFDNGLGIFGMFRELLGEVSLWFGMGLFFIGIVVFFRKKWETALLLFGPFALAVIASGLEKYPYVTRVFLFAMPMILLFITESLLFIRQKLPIAKNIILVTLLVGLFWGSFVQAGIHFVHPREIEETKPLMGYCEAHREQNDGLYVFYATELAFRRYAPLYHIDLGSSTIGKNSRQNWLNYLVDINNLRKNKRVWFLFSHANYMRMIEGGFINEEQYMVQYLDKVGTQKDVLKRTGASLYLYSF